MSEKKPIYLGPPPSDKNKTHKPEVKVVDHSINVLGAVLEVGRGVHLYLGWNSDGFPQASLDRAMLGQAAQESLSLIEQGVIEVARSSHIRSIRDAENIVPIDYYTSMPPIDRPDRGRHHTQDLLVLEVTDSQGAHHTLHIPEAEAMDSILSGHVRWETYNPLTFKRSAVIPTLEMHSLIFPSAKKGDDIVYAMMFRPTQEGESNEPLFQLFLRQTIQDLLALDENQPPQRQKGYVATVNRSIRPNPLDVVGRDAFIVLRALKNFGIINISKRRLGEIKVESSDKPFADQLKILGREFGLLEFNDNVRPSSNVDALNTAELLELVRLFDRSIGTRLRK